MPSGGRLWAPSARTRGLELAATRRDIDAAPLPDRARDARLLENPLKFVRGSVGGGRSGIAVRRIERDQIDVGINAPEELGDVFGVGG